MVVGIPMLMEVPVIGMQGEPYARYARRRGLGIPTIAFRIADYAGRGRSRSRYQSTGAQEDGDSGGRYGLSYGKYHVLSPLLIGGRAKTLRVLSGSGWPNLNPRLL